MRRSLDSWIKHLDGVRLPVPAAAHEKVRRALGDNRRSLRDISAPLVEAGHLNEHGRPFNPRSIKAMVES